MSIGNLSGFESRAAGPGAKRSSGGAADGLPGGHGFAFTLEIVSTGGPDLFVVCKNCGSEVSPYITECPYCGTRLRKRAPKLDRNGRITERPRRTVTPSLSRLRRGEIPGIRHESHPYATGLLVLLGVAGTLLWRTTFFTQNELVIFGHIGKQWWRVFTAPFVYDNTGYAVLTLLVIAIYGWLMERRHGPVMVLALALIGGAGGLGLTAALTSHSFFMGGNGAALALLCAWVVPDLTLLVRRHDFDGDLLGTAVLAGVIALMPVAEPTASVIADGVGIVAGLALGSAADPHPPLIRRSARSANLHSSELHRRRHRRCDRGAQRARPAHRRAGPGQPRRAEPRARARQRPA